MAEDATMLELAGLVSELRGIAESLRATAGSLAAAAERGAGGGADAREVARSALGEIERARSRGKEGERLP